MNLANRLINSLKGILRMKKSYNNVEEALPYRSVLSSEMDRNIKKWKNAYQNKSEWLGENVKSYGLPAFICSEVARMITLEMEVKVNDKKAVEQNNLDKENQIGTRAEFIQKQIDRFLVNIRENVEKGVAFGGFYVKPFVDGDKVMCSTTFQGSMTPKSFDDYNNITEGTFYDTIVRKGIYYTRLEEHTKSFIYDEKNNKIPSIHIRNRAFMSEDKDILGNEIDLHSVPEWQDLEVEADILGREKPMFATFRVPLANNIDMDSPLGVSIFSRALGHIEQADIQYSRILWEFKGSELAIDADMTAMQEVSANKQKKFYMPSLNDRLFRSVNLDKDDLYNVFSPAIRDKSLYNGLNHLLMSIEDDCGIARGTLSESNGEARTAQEVKILRQRSYATVSDTQKALRRCINQIIDIIDQWTTLYNLAPQGEYEVSISFDDSIVTDKNEQLNQAVLMKNLNIISSAELRSQYTGENLEKAQQEIDKIQEELNKIAIKEFEEGAD